MDISQVCKEIESMSVQFWPEAEGINLEPNRKEFLTTLEVQKKTGDNILSQKLEMGKVKQTSCNLWGWEVCTVKENDDRYAVKICALKTIMLGVLERNTRNIKLFVVKKRLDINVSCIILGNWRWFSKKFLPSQYKHNHFTLFLSGLETEVLL